MVSRVFSIMLFASLIGVQISDQDVADIIASYRATQVETLQKRMPPPQTNQQFRQSIHQNLPAVILSNRINNPELTAKLHKVIKPALALYKRQDVYDLIIVDSPTPLMMSDSGVLLVITTGLIQQAQSDDELLGYTAHEIGHEYFVHYSVESKRLLQTISVKGKEPVLQRRLDEVLSLIELQCDAFSALTLNLLGYDSLEFIRGFERMELKYSDFKKNNHPADLVRRRVVEGLIKHHPNPRQSEAFKELKQAVDKL